MLDALAKSQSRAVRRRALDLLVQLGPGVAPLAAERFADAPWYVQRNLLVVLDRLTAWPAGFSPPAYAAHADARVRREMIRVLLKRASERDRAICAGLRDADEQVVRTALSAAIEKCPAAAIPLVVARLATRELDPELELLAMRVLATTRTPAALEALMRRSIAGTGWLRRRRLAVKSPQLLVALTALASHWPHEPAAARVLARARKHEDAEIRAAAWREAS